MKLLFGAIVLCGVVWGGSKALLERACPGMPAIQASPGGSYTSASLEARSTLRDGRR